MQRNRQKISTSKHVNSDYSERKIFIFLLNTGEKKWQLQTVLNHFFMSLMSECKKSLLSLEGSLHIFSSHLFFGFKCSYVDCPHQLRAKLQLDE